MNEPIRILHVVGTMDFGGVETLLMELYRNIDRTKVQFDFLCHNTIEGKYSDEIIKLGGRMFCVKTLQRSGGSILYKRQLKKFFMSHKEYKIIHCHKSSANGYPLFVAKKCGIPVRISHSHIAGYKPNPLFIYYYFRSMKKIKQCATDRFACSIDAAKYLYEKDELINTCIIFNNAIDTEKFRFNFSSRNAIRNQLELDDKFVFVHTGRFMEQKNHKFVIDIFNELSKQISNAVLVLLGDGPLVETVHKQIDDYGLTNKVIFAGSRPNVNDYLSAADAFLFPSLFEGLGIVAVEAQCSGLPTFASDKVPVEAKRTELLKFIPLEETASQWAEKIVPIVLKSHDDKVLNERAAFADEVKASGYDIKEKAKWLENFYLKKIEETD